MTAPGSRRGEIACRVMGTAHRLGIRTAAVWSEAGERPAGSVAAPPRPSPEPA